MPDPNPHPNPHLLQVAEVKRVKKFKNGFITDPHCVSEDMTLTEVLMLKEKLGFCGFPVTKSGKIGGLLVGIITNRDIDFIDDKSRKVNVKPGFGPCLMMPAPLPEP